MASQEPLRIAVDARLERTALRKSASNRVQELIAGALRFGALPQVETVARPEQAHCVVVLLDRQGAFMQDLERQFEKPTFSILYGEAHDPRPSNGPQAIKWNIARVWAGPNNVNSETLPRYFHEFLFRLGNETYGSASSDSWLLATETLIRHVEVLLSEREALRQALYTALGDLDTAKTRVEELELLNELLLKERYRTKEKTDRNLIANVAIAITTLLGPVAAVALDHRLHEPVAAAVESAEKLAVDCGDTSITVELPDLQQEPRIRLVHGEELPREAAPRAIGAGEPGNPGD